ncbi:MAG: MFS transporter [Chloroflexi bacterium]|nr:MFS transporter [Chloroflexota bacterium]MBP8056504.1 MFS transporter [Chloroflexota bacterium]
MSHKHVSSPLPPPEITIRRLIALGLLTRFFTDMGVQIFFPFFAIIAAGLGITPVIMGRLVSVRSAMGLLAPLFGILMDRTSYRLVMRLGLLLAAAGLFIVGSSSGWAMALPGMALMGLGIFSFVPALQAYLSNRLPYERRARGLGVMEYAWALAGMIGLLLAGELIALTSWRVPFFVICGVLLVLSFVYQVLPSAREGGVIQPAAASLARPSFRSFFYLGKQSRSAWAVLVAGGLIMFSTWHTFLNYGTWLQQEYGLDAAALGRAAAILGVADLCASVLVTLISDHVGKRRSVINFTALAALSFAALPWLNRGLLPLSLGLIVARFAFEFTVVSNLALLSEQSPTQRGKILTLGAAFGLIGTTLAGITSPHFYAISGAAGLGWLSAVGMAGACLLNLVLVREPERDGGREEGEGDD